MNNNEKFNKGTKRTEVVTILNLTEVVYDNNYCSMGLSHSTNSKCILIETTWSIPCAGNLSTVSCLKYCNFNPQREVVELL